MRSNVTLGAVAVALGFGIAATSAVALDLGGQAKSIAAPSSLSRGGSASGFSAISTHKPNGLREGSALELSASGPARASGVARPAAGRAWHDGLAALTAASAGAVPQSSEAQRAALTAHAMPANPRGFAAIKAAAGEPRGSDQSLQSLRSNAGNILSPGSK